MSNVVKFDLYYVASDFVLLCDFPGPSQRAILQVGPNLCENCAGNVPGPGRENRAKIVIRPGRRAGNSCENRHF